MTHPDFQAICNRMDARDVHSDEQYALLFAKQEVFSTDLKKLTRAINGNGKPGMAETVRDHARVIAEWRSTTRWIKLGVLAAVGGFLWTLFTRGA